MRFYVDGTATVDNRHRVQRRRDKSNEARFDADWIHWLDNRHLYKYITPMHGNDRWRVRLKKQEVGSYATLAEAIAARDEAQGAV